MHRLISSINIFHIVFFFLLVDIKRFKQENSATSKLFAIFNNSSWKCKKLNEFHWWSTFGFGLFHTAWVFLSTFHLNNNQNKYSERLKHWLPLIRLFCSCVLMKKWLTTPEKAITDKKLTSSNRVFPFSWFSNWICLKWTPSILIKT